MRPCHSVTEAKDDVCHKKPFVFNAVRAFPRVTHKLHGPLYMRTCMCVRACVRVRMCIYTFFLSVVSVISMISIDIKGFFASQIGLWKWDACDRPKIAVEHWGFGLARGGRSKIAVEH